MKRAVADGLTCHSESPLHRLEGGLIEANLLERGLFPKSRVHRLGDVANGVLDFLLFSNAGSVGINCRQNKLKIGFRPLDMYHKEN